MSTYLAAGAQPKKEVLALSQQKTVGGGADFIWNRPFSFLGNSSQEQSMLEALGDLPKCNIH